MQQNVLSLDQALCFGAETIPVDLRAFFEEFGY